MSDGAGAGGEKTEAPTPKRMEDARRRGDIPKSDEVTTMAVYAGVLVAMAAGGSGMLIGAGGAMTGFLKHADALTGQILGPGGHGIAGAAFASALWAIAPIIALPLAAALLGLIAQNAVTFAGSKLAPKLSRLSPVESVKNKFGPTGLVDFAKRLVKMIAVSIVVIIILVAELDTVIGTVRGAPAAVSSVMMALVLKLTIAVTVVAAAIAAIDLAWVRYDHMRKQRMSLQEIKDEAKETEGDPMLKAKRRRRATEIATNKMLADVPGADVVIVNPTHYAVALTWARTPGSAPTCVAKGVDALAATIREIAAEAGVPIHSDPPTARALHAVIDVGTEIHPDHYRAVAAAIRFAETMRARMREREGPQ
ncbi:MAG: flagellar type III secretion system protein FlhB [Pseudomonadota bacterium]